jgi:hypothetical protein
MMDFRVCAVDRSIACMLGEFSFAESHIFSPQNISGEQKHQLSFSNLVGIGKFIRPENTSLVLSARLFENENFHHLPTTKGNAALSYYLCTSLWSRL